MRRTAGTATIIRADTRSIPLADASVDLVVTSPPYYDLRSYQDGGEHYAGQIGDEATPRAYIDNLLDATREWARVLKPGGSMFVNLGDKYGRRGSLSLLPERYRIACVDELGLIARATIVWHKPNAMPESATNRVRRSHEDWVHLTKSEDYYQAMDLIREDAEVRPGMVTWDDRKNGKGRRYSPDNGHNAGGAGMMPNPLGKAPRSVWDISTEPLIVPDHVSHARCCGGRPRPDCADELDHFAAFPMEWPRRLITGWCPSGICTACGEGRRPVVVVDKVGGRTRRVVDTSSRGMARAASGFNAPGSYATYRTTARVTGETCGCPAPDAPTRPAVVLDPFGGTGTTALVAAVLGRLGISVDMSADYCWLAGWRTSDPDQIARAMHVPKPPKQAVGQDDLFSAHMEAS